MKKSWFLTAVLCLLPISAIAADKVVVVPLGGTVGDATPADVVAGKTFSSKIAGKGVVGTLEIREGSTIYTNSIGMKFSLIPAGSFVMGSPAGTGDASHYPIWPAELGRDSDEKQHVVIITKPFYMQTTEVTQEQWMRVMESNPSHFSTCGLDCPVENVSWYNAKNFIDALNALEGRGNCNTLPNFCYSLPTESQWEYAARAGTITAFYSGDITNLSNTPVDPNLNKIGWYNGNSNNRTHPVAQKEPNNWGLYDMSGNVREWCADGYAEYPDGPVTDYRGSSLEPVIRGGSINWLPNIARAAKRSLNSPHFWTFDQGLRLVLPTGQ